MFLLNPPQAAYSPRVALAIKANVQRVAHCIIPGPYGAHSKGCPPPPNALAWRSHGLSARCGCGGVWSGSLLARPVRFSLCNCLTNALQ